MIDTDWVGRSKLPSTRAYGFPGQVRDPIDHRALRKDKVATEAGVSGAALSVSHLSTRRCLDAATTQCVIPSYKQPDTEHRPTTDGQAV